MKSRTGLVQPILHPNIRRGKQRTFGVSEADDSFQSQADILYRRSVVQRLLSSALMLVARGVHLNQSFDKAKTGVV